MLRFKRSNWLIGITATIILAGCGKSAPTVADAPPAPAVAKPETITYSKTPDGELKMDIYKANPSADHHAAILLIHGGGWAGGDRALMAEIASYIAAHGFLAASIDYRLSPKNVWPAQLDDCQTAVRYLRSHAKELGIGDKIGAAGISAGGHLAFCLGTMDTLHDGDFKGMSSRVQAVASISGIHDLNVPLTAAGERFKTVPHLLAEPEGKPNKDARSKASPLTYADLKTAPTIFLHGKSDPLVPAEQTQIAAKKLDSLKVSNKALYVEQMGHDVSPTRPNEKQALDALVDWMTQNLK